MNTKKELRIKVWLRYNKHCAYCGKELKYKDMQVDHMTPKYEYEMYSHPKISLLELNGFDNLMPSCRRCNHYKRGCNLEQFRHLMNTLHERIEGKYIMKVAIDYEMIKIKPFDGVFYYEGDK